MDYVYRILVRTTLSILPFVLIGCMTQDLLTKAKNDSSYTEEVSSILISKDGEKLVFAGEKYHYIFDAPMELSNSFRSSFRKSLYAKFKHFRVNLDNQVIGSVTIVLDESASKEDKDVALRMGYKKHPVGPNYEYGHAGTTLEVSLSGVRYSAGALTLQNEGYRLNYTYLVEVHEERGPLERAALTAATPITVLADGVLILGGTTLIILMSGPH